MVLLIVIAWLHEGDRNTKYFHRKASSRHKTNRIQKLKRGDGTWTSDTREMEGMARDFFQNLYTCEDDTNPDIVTSLMRECVHDHMNETLCETFTEKEIRDALF
jgi:hypothetical protein